MHRPHPHSLISIHALVLPWVVFIACSETATRGVSDGPAFTSSDSAGVELAVTRFSESVPSSGWTISEEPTVVYGETGDDPVQFVWIRDAIHLPDGRVIALDGRANELFFFSAAGDVTARTGGTGDGPGELQRPAGLVLVGDDSILVYDARHQRFSLFDTRGEFIDDRRLESPPGGEDAPRLPIYGAADVSGGHVVLIGEGYYFSTGMQGDYTIENPTMRYDPDGSYVDQVAEPAIFWFYGTNEGSEPRLFGGRQQVEAGTGRVYVADREEYEIRVYDPGAGLMRVQRLDRPRRPVTDEMVERYRDWMAGRIDDPDRRSATLERIDRGPVADSLAWIRGLTIDALGSAWVTESRVTDEAPLVTTVFTADGAWIGEIDVPDDFIPLDIGEDYLLGSLTDELDVQHLVLFDLERTAP